ncbi:NUMOD4 motif-containing HNH endonuclease [Burkholderia multivorans]|uniref:NUMOD4 motif-containing HNH endonuclease n=1 Tax=Burkholderia multivorans TaxID=87883 RepID=UPI0021C10B78|nr:NUMOD4 motif-containing HNH endonuclease [Burkholderia multivorans]
MQPEIWKPVPGYGGHYEASNIGRVRSVGRVVEKRTRHGGTMLQRYAGRLLSPTGPNEDGHVTVHIGVDGKKYKVGVHRLVLLAFRGLPLDGQEACHKNGIGTDNRLSNLRWDTHLENNRDRKRHAHYAIGECHRMAKLSEEQARQIKYGGLTLREAMKRFAIRKSQIFRIRRGECWSHI